MIHLIKDSTTISILALKAVNKVDARKRGTTKIVDNKRMAHRNRIPSDPMVEDNRMAANNPTEDSRRVVIMVVMKGIKGTAAVVVKVNMKTRMEVVVKEV